MRSKVICLLCIFVFTALLLYPASQVFAEWSIENFLENIAEGSSVYIHATYSEEDGKKSIINARYTLEMDGLTQEYVNENGAILYDGQQYILTLYLSQDEKATKNLTGSSNAIAYNDGSKCYIQYLSSHGYNIYEDNEVLYQLTPVDDNGNKTNGNVIEYVGKLNYELDEDGNVKIRYVNEFEEMNWWDITISDLFSASGRSKIERILTESLTKILIPCGDSYLHMITLAVGESVSIDKVVYNDIRKTNIDFFEKEEINDDEGLKLNTPLKSIMRKVVNTWYGFFQKIAITVYLILLLYIGIKILLTSTANGKANYKSIFTAWVTGVVMLFFFPYVMKYAIELNNGLCVWLGEETSKLYGEDGGKLDSSYMEEDVLEGALSYYGKDTFVIKMLGRNDTEEDFNKNAIINNYFGKNAMMRIRYIADKRLDLPLAIVYFILIGQLLALLVLYYKRVFMLAFLITIFPLVTMFYPLKKIGDVKMDPFGTWFKEFIVNVFVQVFHAATYTVVVTIGVNSYLENDNWLFMIMCILFLFEGEKIIRAIFNINSRMNSIGDMATAGAMAWSITQKMGGLFGGKDKKAGPSGEKDPDKQATKDRKKAATAANMGDTPGAMANKAAAAAAGSGSGGTGAAGGSGSGTAGDDEVKLGRKVPGGSDNLYKSVSDSYTDRVKKNAKESKLNKVGKVLGGANSVMAQTYGTMAGLTLGMAQNDGKNGAETALGTAMAGKKLGGEIGQGVNSLVGGTVNKIAGIHAGYTIANEYLSGDRDDELGIDMSEVENEADKALKKKKAEAYQKIRETAAKMARRKGFGFDNSAEILNIKETLDRNK